MSNTQLELSDVLAKDVSTAVISTMRETFGVDVTSGPAEYGDGMVRWSAIYPVSSVWFRRSWKVR